MKSSSRRSLRRSLENGRRRKSFLKVSQRRLFAEKLESRELLAGDILHNVDDPFDTDASGVFAPVDILHVINQLNQPATTAGGEGPGGTTTYFNDVNGDGFVSPIDALRAINEYNARSAEGAGDPLVRMRVTAVALDNHPTTGLPVPITTIAKGTDYYVRVTVQDLRMGGVDGDPNGVYAAYLDVLYNKGLTNVELEEIQRITFGNNPEGGTFTLSFDADGPGGQPTQTTAAINYTLAGGAPETTISNNIQAALDTRFGKNLFFVSPVSSGDPNRYFVRFMGAFGDRNVAMMTGNATGLVSSTAPPNPTITFTEDTPGYTRAQYEADRVNPDTLISGPAIRAFRQAFRFSPQYDNDAGGANDGQNDPLNPPPDPNVLDEAGNFAVGTATLGSSVRELFRVRMNTLDAGTSTITGSVAEMVSPQDDTLVYGGGGSSDRDVVEPDLIDIVNPPNFTITEPFSAIANTFNFTEFSASPAPVSQSLNVKANDINAGSTTISAISTTSLSLGTLAIAAGGNSINFLPLADVNGTAAFTYTLRNATTGITDTATVTIIISAVNDAPVNAVPASPLATAEETNLIINGVSIADIDVNETAGALMQAELSVINGTLNLASITGLSFPVGGNGTAAMTIQGSLADVNAAINGLTYTPANNYAGPDTFRIISNDLANTGTGGAKTDNDTVTINVTAVNDAPTVSLPGDDTVLAGDPVIISGTDVDDVDVGTSNLTVTLSATTIAPADTHLTLGMTTNLNFTVGMENGKSTVQFTGKLVDVQNALNSFEFIPAVDDGGSQSTISIIVDDGGATGSGGAKTGSDSLVVDVIPLTLPFARRDPTTSSPASVAAFTVVEGSSNASLPVLDNDLVDDPAGPPATVKLLLSVTDPPNGTTSVSSDVVLYTPDANFWGTDTFTYVMNQDVNADTVKDGTDSTGTVTVTITNVNDAPVAVDSSLAIDEDPPTPTIITLSVSDVDNNNNVGFVSTLTPTITGGPANGNATVISSGVNAGKISYVPTLNFSGSDQFTYTVNDGQGGVSNTATVFITVNPVNDAPVANAGTLTAAEEVLTNGTLVATDVDSASLTYSLVSTANAHGTVLITNSATGAYTYTSELNYNGPASFTFKANDGFLDSNTATVTITVTAVNDAPVANPDSYLVEEETLLNADNSSAGRMSVRANDTDVDNATSTLVVTLVSGPTHASAVNGGTFTLNSNGTFTYRAEVDYQGPDSFVYQVSDGSLTSTATVSITVTEKNDPPVAVNDSYDATEDTLLSKTTVEGVRDGLGLDDDPDANNPNDTLTVVLVSPPTHSSVFSLNADGSFSYQGAANYNGPDSFKYKLTDPFGVSSNTATVSINIVAVNDNPTARDDGSASAPLTLIKNTVANPFVDQEINVTANDDNSPDFNVVENITVISIGTGPDAPQNGTVTISGDLKKVLYTPDIDFEGSDQFTYTISDGNGGTATATVFLEVVNFIPTDITGNVFADTNNNGVKDPNEKPLAGVKITLQGHDTIFNLDFGADTDNNASNDVAALVVYTDINGNYRFDAPGSLRPGMRPGTYSITEEQPAFMRDGIDQAGNNASLLANDRIGMTLPLLGIAGGINGNNFAERGLDPSVVSISDILSSTTGNGLILAVNGSTMLWYTKLTGWDNLQSCTVVMNGANSATFTFTDMQNNSHVRTISQVGNPRFRVMGRLGGDELIRLEGSAADFGLDLLAAGNNPQPEGEADVPGDAGYSRNVDAVMEEVGSA